MGRVSRAALLAVAQTTALLAWPVAARAQWALVRGEHAALELGGYARTLSGVYHTGDRWPETEPTTGISAQVLRLKWRLALGDRVVLQAHDRIQVQLSTSPLDASGSSLAGFGVSAVPGRSVDLSSRFLDEARIQGWHDVDRLSVTVHAGPADVTVGRQAITWGVSNLFPVADLWAQFSPFELDTEEKPGSDAVRILAYPRAGWELDAVVADRGSRDDLSAGVRASVSLSWADVHVAGGKFWNEALVMAGIAAPVGAWKVRAEGVLPYDLDEDAWTRVRATVGVDWLHGEWALTGEMHYNGLGARDAADYGTVLTDASYARGESYFLGRTYAGGVVIWSPGNDRLSFTVSALVNLGDPSAALTPVATYDLGQNVRISAGGMMTPGAAPAFDPGPRLRSEYGSYGQLFFTRMSLYF